ncbi:hypothetical protein ACQ3I4_14920 [Zafaria sp. Z1313]|uniref:hypothetical protein n=1 Tax=unclassified Zafaria TaxID=2828765 RepID=UPI002E7A5E36|nr:hypothetical protein [Zafaria sp. J156]MEE1622305.1 hypothetical protein [Zafaria sp. J156]
MPRNRRPRLAALVAAVLALPLLLAALLAGPVGATADPAGPARSAGSVADAVSVAYGSTRHAPDGHAGSAPASSSVDDGATDCPLHAPAPACHGQTDVQPVPAGTAPRPDTDRAWGAPGFAADLSGRPDAAGATSPDLNALSVSRT